MSLQGQVPASRAARRRLVQLSLGVGVALAAPVAFAQTHPAVAQNHAPSAEHVDQADLNALNLIDGAAAHELAFELGDELFEAAFNSLDGGGADVGNGERFTRVPRADLAGWSSHFPPRATGPNSQACIDCHNTPSPDGAGVNGSNVHRDPQRGGLGSFIQRNTPILFGIGATQRLAEEMTDELMAIKDAIGAEAMATRRPVTADLVAKGVNFGQLRARPTRNGPVYNTTRVVGVSRDLVVRPFQWKGNFATVREFNRDASHNELGMQSVEDVGLGVDGDGDGVTDELTVGDQTALEVYLAGQPRPVTGRELADAGVIPPLTLDEIAAIENGEQIFEDVGCAGCHVPSMILHDPVYSTPSQSPHYREAVYPSGLVATDVGVDPANAIRFDMTTDTLDNQLDDGMGGVIDLGNLESDGNGGAIVRSYSDLKWHDLGDRVAEQIDETGTGASTFITKELWGVGDTGPYMHDGSSTTLTGAIARHGGEATASRLAFFARSAADQADVLAFLGDLRIFLDGETAGIGE